MNGGFVMVCSEIINDMVVRHYSDRDKMLRQVETGTFWVDAVDVLPCRFTYEETDIPIEEEASIEDKAEAYGILIGEQE